MTELLVARGLAKTYPARGRRAAAVPAVDGVDIALHRSETLGLVGESGCGKSTLGRLLVGLEPASAGDVIFDGSSVETRDGPPFRAARGALQYVFQNPLQALNPRLSVGFQVREVLAAHRPGLKRGEADDHVARAFRDVGLDPALRARYPHQLSGGQRQRVCLARSLIVEPRVVVFDEPTSALDLSVQAEVLALIAALTAERDLAAIVISHDLRVVRVLSDRIAVMYLGEIVEIGAADEVFHDPRHPYAAALIGALLTLDPDAPRRPPPVGEPPDHANLPAGCRFAPRCPLSRPRCRTERPKLKPGRSARLIACFAAEAEAAGKAWPVPVRKAA